MTHLKKLSLVGTDIRISWRGLGHITSLQALRDLQLSVDGTDEELRAISKIRGLENLTLRTRRLTEKGLGYLTSLEELRNLYVEVSPKPETKHFAPVLKPPRLRSLELWGVPVSDEWALKLRSCQNLERLHLFYPGQLSDAGVAGISAVKGLRDLAFSGVDSLTNRALEHLATLTELRELSLAGCTAISDEGVHCIGKLRQLQRLNLSWTKITNQAIPQLKQLKHLEYLDISDTSVTDACLQDLARLSHLKELWIRGIGITTAGQEFLEKALPGCKIFTTYGSGGGGRVGGKSRSNHR